MNNNFYEIPNDWYGNFDNTFMSSIPQMDSISNMSLAESKVALERGNLFNDLYLPYKNYKYRMLRASNKREELLLNILMHNFILTELDLYLDTNPKDTNKVNLYNKYLQNKKRLIDEYENTYGPLLLDGLTGRENDFTWVNRPWPWEVWK